MESKVKNVCDEITKAVPGAPSYEKFLKAKDNPDFIAWCKQNEIETAERMHCDVEFLKTREGLIKSIMDNFATLGILKFPGAVRDKEGRLVYNENGEILMAEET